MSHVKFQVKKAAFHFMQRKLKPFEEMNAKVKAESGDHIDELGVQIQQ